MCGLLGLGLDDRSASPDPALLSRMAGTIAHRGPDDEGIVVRGPLGLAFRRLSIIDLAGGHQPIENEAGDVVVCCNGEIYNYRELRRGLEQRGHVFRTNSDVEVIVHLYEERGEALCEDLIGMFAFCILDLRPGHGPRVVLGRDRLGIKPMYWARTKAGLVWGSETKALLASGAFDRTVDPRRLLDFLVQGYVGGPSAVWAGMQRLGPATTLSWRPGEQPEMRRYWDLPTDGLRDPADEPTRSAEILEWIDRVVGDRLMADVPLGAFLSGGIDSNAVVEAMSRASADPVLACSVGFAERSHDELDLARATARALGADHRTEVLDPDPALAVETLPWFYDEPLADPSTVPTFLVSRMAREHVTVALSGDGGDETFAGYRRYAHDVAENRLRRGLGSAGRAAFGAAGRAYPKLDWAPRFLRAKTFLSNVALDPARAYFASVTQLGRSAALELLNPDVAASLVDYDPFDAFEDHYRRPRVDDPLYRAQYADFHTYLPDQILAKVDRASMAVSLEVRVPLLDHRFVERFAPLPAGEKVRGSRGKHALREALRSRVRAEVLDGVKRGFDTPLRGWLKGPLHDAVSDAIEGLPADWFRRDVLAERAREHSAGARDHSRLLWSVLVLEHWRRRHDAGGLAS